MSKKRTTLNTNISGSINTTANTTTTISSGGSNLVFRAHNSNFTISTPKTTYHVLGEDIEVSGSGYQDGITTMMIATLNVLGKPYLDELHKNNTFFPKEIEEYLEKKFKWIERDAKIDNIIN